jgi:hypothetical protein
MRRIEDFFIIITVISRAFEIVLRISNGLQVSLRFHFLQFLFSPRGVIPASIPSRAQFSSFEEFDGFHHEILLVFPSEAKLLSSNKIIIKSIRWNRVHIYGMYR